MNPNQAPRSSENVSKVTGMVGNIINMVVAVPIALITIGVAYYLHTQHASLAVLVIALCVGFGFSILLFISAAKGFVALRNAKDPGVQHQFQSDIATDYKLAGAVPISLANERVVGWLGPVTGGEGILLSSGGFGKETVRQTANTLIFTNKQIICLQLTNQDVPEAAEGDVRNALTDLLSVNPNDAVDKMIQFASLNASRWPVFMDALLTQPLEKIIETHITYGLPYSTVGSFKFNTNFINKGITLFLTDGSKQRFNAMQPQQLETVVATLSQYVQQQG